MNLKNIVSAIDEEITRLTKARQLLAQTSTKHGPKLRASPTGAPGKRKHRRISAEGRARIAAAQKARWAKLKK